VLAGSAPVLVHNVDPDPAGVIYLRTDLNTGGEYVGQAQDWDRFLERQKEHARANPNATYDFDALDRAAPGQDLDVREEDWIRAGGGPTNKSNPNGGLENRRHQMNAPRYDAAGGTCPL
jgi:hypothetical protein